MGSPHSLRPPPPQSLQHLVWFLWFIAVENETAWQPQDKLNWKQNMQFFIFQNHAFSLKSTEKMNRGWPPPCKLAHTIWGECHHAFRFWSVTVPCLTMFWTRLNIGRWGKELRLNKKVRWPNTPDEVQPSIYKTFIHLQNTAATGKAKPKTTLHLSTWHFKAEAPWEHKKSKGLPTKKLAFKSLQ